MANTDSVMETDIGARAGAHADVSLHNAIKTRRISDSWADEFRIKSNGIGV